MSDNVLEILKNNNIKSQVGPSPVQDIELDNFITGLGDHPDETIL